MSLPIRSRTTTSLSLAWSRPSNVTGTFIGYRLEVTSLSFPDAAADFVPTNSSYNLSTTTLEHTLTGLQQFGRYRIKLYAINANSLGFFGRPGASASLDTTTLPGRESTNRPPTLSPPFYAACLSVCLSVWMSA
ncbi:unnamed protein product, partial [Protopolystoma xenopodis]